MEMFGLKGNMVQMANANGVIWYRHALRRDDGYVLRKALEIEVKAKRKQGRQKNTWKMQVEKENAMNRVRWRVGDGEIAVRVW